MNKAELIEGLTEKLGTDRRTTTAVVEGFVDAVVRAVHRGESVTITGFGVFEKRERAPRVARNPRTGETVRVKATHVPAFRPGAQFKAVIAGEQELSSDGVAVKRGSGAATPPAVAARAAGAGSAAGRPAGRQSSVKNTGTTTSAAKKTAAKKPSSKSAAAGKSRAHKAAAAKKSRGK